MPDFYHFIEALKQRLRLPLPAHEAHRSMTGRSIILPSDVPTDHKVSAVTCLLFQKENDWQLVLMRRVKDESSHSGQIGFPGGKVELGDPDLAYTALRELEEEIGIPMQPVEVLGALSPLYIPVSNFLVHPFLAMMATPPIYIPNPDEVAEVIELPLTDILNPKKKDTQRLHFGNHLTRTVPVYRMDSGDYIWGATAMILAELEQVWQEVISQSAAL